jgi:hypothetical protein
VGFSISQTLPGLASVAELGRRGFSVTLASGQPLRMTQPVALALEDRGTEAG